MWKLLVTFLFSRTVLLCVALFAINQKWTPKVSTTAIPKIQPLITLRHQFVKIINESGEAKTIRDIKSLPFLEKIKQVRNPAIWLAATFAKVFPFSEGILIILLSQIFCFLIFRETFQILSRIINEEIAISSVTLLILWPMSFQWSLSLTYPFEIFLVLIATRQALDNQWLQTGLALGVLSVFSSFPFAMLPYLAFLFFFFQRHFQWSMVTKKFLYFLLPIAVGMIVSHTSLRNVLGLYTSFDVTRIFNFFRPGEIFSLSTLAFVILICGCVAAFLNYSEWIHKLLPFHFLFIFLLLIPNTGFAYHMALGGIAFECIVRISVSVLHRAIQILFWGLSMYMTYRVFLA